MKNKTSNNGDEKRLLHSLLKNNNSVILLIDPKTGNILDSNETGRKYYGYKNLESENIKAITQLTDAEVAKCMEKACNEEENQFEFKHLLADGTARDVQVCWLPVTFQKKKLLYSFIHDITEKNETEHASKILSEAVHNLIEFNTPSEIYNYTCKKLYEILNEKAIVTIVEFDNPNNRWKMMEYRGINSNFDKTLKSIGINIGKMTGEINTDFIGQLKKGKITSLEFDLHRLSNGKYSQETANALKKVIPIKSFFTIPLIKKETIYGNVTIIITQKSNALNLNLIEAFVLQAAIFLEKLFINIELRESERKLIEAERLAHIGRYELNLDTGKTIWSEETFNIFGFDSKKDVEPTFEKYHSLVYPADRNKLIETFTICKAENKKFNLVYRIIRKDNQIRYVHSIGQLDRNTEPKSALMIGTIRDITKQKKAEQDLINSRNYYQALIENSTDVVSILDKKATIIYISPSHKQILGYDTNEIEGISNLSLIHPEDFERVKNQFHELIKEPNAIDKINFRFQHKNGQWLHLEGTVKNLIQNQSVKGLVLNFRDATKRIESEKELIKAKEKAEENERLKTAFLANMSHEIRTPMNGIMGFIDILSEPGVSKGDKKTYFDLVKKSGERLLTTINDIIEISKIESNQTFLYLSDENMNDILQEHLAFFLPEAESKGIKLKISEKSEHHLAIRTDKNKLNSILTNLIKNAIKFTPDGIIKFGCIQKKNQLEFFVEDTGIGIATERIKAIFNRFEQEEMGITRGHEGSGLGLSISKAYAAMLGGKLWVKSEKGKGSTFFFTINLNPGANYEEEKNNDSGDLNNSKTNNQEKYWLQKMMK